MAFDPDQLEFDLAVEAGVIYGNVSDWVGKPVSLARKIRFSRKIVAFLRELPPETSVAEVIRQIDSVYPSISDDVDWMKSQDEA